MTSLAPLISELEAEFGNEIAHARAADSERLDNTIDGIIDAVRNPAFKQRLTDLDREIHRVFDAVEAASPDPETAQTLELMKGIVVLSSIMNAIAEVRIDSGTGTAGGEDAMDLVAARRADSERLDNTIHGIIEATRDEEFKARLTGLDREIHSVFQAVQAASGDPEAVQTLELMEGIVVLSSIMNAIAEVRIDTADPTVSPLATADLVERLSASLSEAWSEDSERLDLMIHALTERTEDPALQSKIRERDAEIHRIFEITAERLSDDPDALARLELVKGIVILSNITDALAEAEIDGPAPVITVSGGPDDFTVVGAGFDPSEGIVITIAHTATAAVIVEGSLLSAAIEANETGAFMSTGTLPLGAGVYTLLATGKESGGTAAAPVVVEASN